MPMTCSLADGRWVVEFHGRVVATASTEAEAEALLLKGVQRLMERRN